MKPQLMEVRKNDISCKAELILDIKDVKDLIRANNLRRTNVLP